KQLSGCVTSKETTWSESPFGGGLRYNENAIGSRRANRAPGRGRAGECPSSRLGLTSYFGLLLCSQLLKQSARRAIGQERLLLPRLLCLPVGLPASFEFLPPRGGLIPLFRCAVELDQPQQGLVQADLFCRGNVGFAL